MRGARRPATSCGTLRLGPRELAAGGVRQPAANLPWQRQRPAGRSLPFGGFWFATSPRSPRRPGLRPGFAGPHRRIDHGERIFLACAAFGRHTGSATMPEPDIVARLLSPERYQRARALGAAIRLGCDLSGRSPELLGHARLDLKPNTIALQADEACEASLLGEQVIKRANTLAGILERELKIKTQPSPSIAPTRKRLAG